MTQDTLLYESARVWDQSLQPGQKNLARAICDFFPQGIESALDVGCGDGKLTSTIISASNCSMIGLDSSKEALSRCTFKTIHGDATNLPFENQTFDLVLTADMLEHLPKSIEDMVWQQLFRVSKGWVMVAVPFREELSEATAKCRYCDQLYHVNWHMRSYDWPDLVARCPDDYEVDKIILAGEAWTSHHVLETKFRREILNEWNGWLDAFCIYCNQPGTSPDLIEPLPSLTSIALGNIIYAARSEHPDFRSHSEILVIYRKKHISRAIEESFIKARQFEAVANEVIFDEARIESNLISYPSVARVVRAIDSGLIIQFPAYSSYDFLVIKTSKDECELQLSLDDGLGTVFNEQLMLKFQGSHSISLQRKTVPSYYGILLRVKSIAFIESIRLGEAYYINILRNPNNTQYSYYLTRFQHIATYIQVTEPCYFDSSAEVKMNINRFHWIDFFKQVELLVKKERDQLQTQNQFLLLKQDQLQAQNQSLILEQDQLQAQNQSLILERQQMILEHNNLKNQNYKLLGELYALHNHFEVRVINKINIFFKKIMRFLIK